MHKFVFESRTIRPVSLNAAFATLRNGRRVRSKAYSEFAKLMKIALKPRHFDLNAFKSHFNPNIHELHAKLELGLPELYTEDGKISLKSGDAANYEKTITDCIMIGVLDDAYITHWEISKFHCNDRFFRFTIEIITR